MVHFVSFRRINGTAFALVLVAHPLCSCSAGPFTLPAAISQSRVPHFSPPVWLLVCRRMNLCAQSPWRYLLSGCVSDAESRLWVALLT